MKRNRFALGTMGSGLACLFGLSTILTKPLDLEAAATPKINVDSSPIARDALAGSSYATVIKKASPSVVNIYTTKLVREPRFHPFLNPFFGEPEDDSGRSKQHREQSLGSGVVISEDGYILTNNHVVEGADEIKVALAKSKEEYTAKVIGTDPPTDIAVLKIEARNLGAITFSDSENLEVGDVVLAIGNPFGVGQTVTMGIVSAVGRGGFGIVDYEDFVQTDASINPGNSGGALVDARGRLVGVNTAIISRTGGSSGIGFAVPANMARGVMDRIIAEGKVVRGYLGVYIQQITPELAKQFDLPDTNGALIGGVTPDTPAAKAGLKEGDVIIEYKGSKVLDNRQLRLNVAQTSPATKVTLKILRDGKEKTLHATLEELPADQLASNKEGGRGRGPSNRSDTLDGVEVTDLDPRLRRQFGIPSHVIGALVTQVDPDSSAYDAGLRAGSVIMSINRQPVKSADDAVDLTEKQEGQRLLLRVWYQGGSQYIVVDASKRTR
jgi:serine protease Do